MNIDVRTSIVKVNRMFQLKISHKTHVYVTPPNGIDRTLRLIIWNINFKQVEKRLH